MSSISFNNRRGKILEQRADRPIVSQGYTKLQPPLHLSLTSRRWLINIPPEANRIITGLRATPVDLYGAFELVLLHELSHTYTGGNTQDVPGVGVGGFEYARSVPGALAWDNAENVAFMGLLSKLAQLGFEAEPNGNLVQSVARISGLLRKRSRVDGSRFDRHD